MLFDSHAHLNDARFDEDREALIKKLQEEHVDLVLNPGADIETSISSVELANKYDFIYAAVGVHPHDVKDLDDTAIDTLRKLATENEKVVAIGEIGLDYYYDNSPREVQKEWFKKQIELANELKLPIIIHDRDAHQDTFEIIKNTKSPEIGCVLHCYSGNVELAKEYVKMGYYIGVGGVVTFKNSRVLKEVVKAIPLECIVVETDCPYLAPAPHRGKRNSSAYLPLVIEEIARLKEITAEEVENVTYENAQRLYGLIH